MLANTRLFARTAAAGLKGRREKVGCILYPTGGMKCLTEPTGTALRASLQHYLPATGNQQNLPFSPRSRQGHSSGQHSPCRRFRSLGRSRHAHRLDKISSAHQGSDLRLQQCRNRQLRSWKAPCDGTDPEDDCELRRREQDV